LLELGIIKTEYRPFTIEDIQKGTLDTPAEEAVQYKLSNFGEAVFMAIVEKHRINKEIASAIIEYDKKKE
jgi:hypothetical protein